MTGPAPVPVPDEELDRLLASAGNAVLVGGQALAYWMGRYGIDAAEAPEAVVTRDVDFLGGRADAERLAAGIGGTIEVPKAMSILSAVVRKKLAGGKAYEVDLLRRINGVPEAEVRRRAERVESKGGASFLVMSPIECLVSRLENLRTIRDKQTPAGAWQARMAVRVARKYIEALLANGEEKAAIRAATSVVAAATHAMGLGAYRSHGIDPLDAVPIERYANRQFVDNQWARSLARLEKVRAVLARAEPGR